MSPHFPNAAISLSWPPRSPHIHFHTSSKPPKCRNLPVMAVTESTHFHTSSTPPKCRNLLVNSHHGVHVSPQHEADHGRVEDSQLDVEALRGASARLRGMASMLNNSPITCIDVSHLLSRSSILYTISTHLNPPIHPPRPERPPHRP